MDTEVLGYTVIYEHVSEENCGASVPDLPGLAVGGSTKEEVEQKIQEGTRGFTSKVSRKTGCLFLPQRHRLNPKQKIALHCSMV